MSVENGLVAGQVVNGNARTGASRSDGLFLLNSLHRVAADAFGRFHL